MNWEIGGPEQEIATAEQGKTEGHRLISSHINHGAVCAAIAAIFAAFRPAAVIGIQRCSRRAPPSKHPSANQNQ